MPPVVRALLAIAGYGAALLGGVGLYVAVAGNEFDGWMMAVVVLVHVATGAVIGRWWATSLPLLPAIVATASEGSDLRGVETFLTVVLVTAPGGLAVAVGVVLRAAVDRRRLSGAG